MAWEEGHKWVYETLLRQIVRSFLMIASRCLRMRMPYNPLLQTVSRGGIQVLGGCAEGKKTEIPFENLVSRSGLSMVNSCLSEPRIRPTKTVVGPLTNLLVMLPTPRLRQGPAVCMCDRSNIENSRRRSAS